MKTRPPPLSTADAPESFPNTSSLAALRAWYEGMTARQAVARHLPHRKASG